jgi:hypothetical protein
MLLARLQQDFYTRLLHLAALSSRVGSPPQQTVFVRKNTNLHYWIAYWNQLLMHMENVLCDTRSSGESLKFNLNKDLCEWRCCWSGLWRCVDSQVDTNVMEHTVSICKAQPYCRLHRRETLRSYKLNECLSSVQLKPRLSETSFVSARRDTKGKQHVARAHRQELFCASSPASPLWRKVKVK